MGSSNRAERQPDRAVNIEEKTPEVLNLASLEQSSMEKLRSDIEKSGGLLRIFIHPDFTEYEKYEKEWFEAYGENKNKELEEKLKKIEDAFLKITSAKTDNLPPVVVFLEPWYKDKIIEKTKKIAGRDTYFVLTEAGNPNPKGEGSENVEIEEKWKNVTDILNKTGVRKILMAGAELYIDKNSDDKHLSGCLGSAINILGNKFELEISSLTYPESSRNTKS